MMFGGESVVYALTTLRVAVLCRVGGGAGATAHKHRRRNTLRTCGGDGGFYAVWEVRAGAAREGDGSDGSVCRSCILSSRRTRSASWKRSAGPRCLWASRKIGRASCRERVLLIV